MSCAVVYVLGSRELRMTLQSLPISLRLLCKDRVHLIPASSGSNHKMISSYCVMKLMSAALAVVPRIEHPV